MTTEVETLLLAVFVGHMFEDSNGGGIRLKLDQVYCA